MPAKNLLTKECKEVIALDFSSSSVRVLYCGDSKPGFFSYSLAPFLLREKLPVLEGLLEVLSWVERDLGLELQHNGHWRPSIVLVGRLVSLELKKILSYPPLDPLMLLRRLKRLVFFARSGIVAFDNHWVSGDVDPEKVVRWLPFPLNPNDLADYLFNVSLFTQTIPDTRESLYIKQALVRESLKQLVGKISGRDGFYNSLNKGKSLLIGSAFSQVVSPSQAVSIFLDGVRPRGAVFLERDLDQWLPCLLVLYCYYPKIAKKAVKYWPRNFLGTAVGLGMEANGTLILDDKTTSEFHLGEGELFQFFVPASKSGWLRARTRNGLSDYRVRGGEAGLIIDTRSYDLILPESFEQRKMLLDKWAGEVGARGQKSQF
ncbi:hypothetical protein COT52_00935 [candidate division WWE3 bacterium CG08_land_8_20_14_0_20_43_13]|uniref:Uncharacterized protein n=1 Tax=candidate division WWE3 bacterium CG08_land_8_20_14_0_20_43_13 TaxID=1975087 RepID=A0A2H0X7U8_UNCKA|nr:MAG: hypothetical protein COT52_00935 [candidate division WWE3 bacterium CG08_land_8_20_14_0_20_43_13]